MNGTRMLAHIFLSLTVTLTVTPQTDDPLPQAPICGTETEMANTPRSLKTQLSAAATASQVDELLLYINFNSYGSLVRPGLGNADTLTSSIVNSFRFCPAPSLNQEQQDEIVRRVSDDFSPFNIRITTDSAEFADHPRFNKQMVLITTTPAVIGQPSHVGGVSPFIGIGLRLPGDFVFVFSSQYLDDPRAVAAVVSHEAGHILGLGHQHLFTETCGFVSEYHPGFGSGPLAFDPLMGDALTDGVNNWFAQSCLDPIFGVRQNDYDLISSQVVVRPDDFPNEPVGDRIEASSFSGILERAGDADLIKINFRNPGEAVIVSDNIDLKVSVLNPGGRVMGVFNDPDSTNVTIPSAKGMRYLKIEAADNANMSAQFMTGKYHISY